MAARRGFFDIRSYVKNVPLFALFAGGFHYPVSIANIYLKFLSTACQFTTFHHASM